MAESPATVSAPAPVVVALTPVQVDILTALTADIAAHQATVAAVKAEADALTARRVLIARLIKDAHQAPEDAVLDLSQGVLAWVPAPVSPPPAP